MQPSLTFTIPKPLIEFASKPIILYQIEALEAAGVTEVILAVNYQAQAMRNFLKEHVTKLKIKITFSIESEPLGTAGPLALARDKLIDGSGEPFFVLNGDVFCAYPFKKMITFHKSHAGEASILITKNYYIPNYVNHEALPYGAIGMERSTGKVRSFVEKPWTHEIIKRLSAGIYLLNPSVLDGIELKRTSLEKQVFPKMVADGKVYGVWLQGFWLDTWLLIDQQRVYICGLEIHLRDLRKRRPRKLASGAHIVGDVVVDETAEIGEGCVIGPDVAIGPGCIIEAGVKISRSAIMHGTHIMKEASVTDSIIGWRSSVGQLAKLDKATMFAVKFATVV